MIGLVLPLKNIHQPSLFEPSGGIKSSISHLHLRVKSASNKNIGHYSCFTPLRVITMMTNQNENNTINDEDNDIVTFPYFRNPQNFATRTNERKPCSICNKKGIWLDGGGLYGEQEIDCICDKCLVQGKLKELGITTNEASAQDSSKNDIIEYCTPPLPTWQDRLWPYQENDYCIFEKIASKTDFTSKDEFLHSFSQEDQDMCDLDDIWENYVIDAPITSIQDGNYDTSIYLFTTSSGKKYCTMDAN
mmetsp:Transcript_23596/g.33103  ORF Transcript_23596/g.33103 Transcript_23596/m.33103 type:complete len:247 (-) Transcript_23596:279-1019(-)